jgi:non-specific serine/threonine protein kinase
LPLAIELAAIRVRALSVGQIADRMDEQLELLTGESTAVGPNHHGTLRALIDWSYQRCTAAEADFWERVSVFAGSFDLAAAESVAADVNSDADEVLALVDGLLNKSILLREEHRDTVRYRMLEPLRQYGQDKLRAGGRLVEARRRHRDHFATLIHTFHDEWLSDQQAEWCSRLQAEHPNLRAALEFSATSAEEVGPGLMMAWNLKEFFLMRGLNNEGRVLISKLLAVAPEREPTRHHARWALGFLARLQGDLVAYREAIELLAEADAEEVVAHTHLLRGYDALIDDRMPEAAEQFGRAVAEFEAQEDLASTLWARFNLGIAVGLAGDLDKGQVILREAIAAYAERGEIFWRAWAVWSLGALELLAGDVDQARDAVQQVLRFEQRVTDRVLAAFALTIASGVATRSGDDRRSARTFGAATAAWKRIAATPTNYGAFGDNIRDDIELVTSRMGLEAAGEEFSAGYAMSLDEAIAYALTDSPAPELTQPRCDILTRRESEVADLVAQGMTNQEIADTLVISRRTAETHVNNILNKLGFSSRAQVAAWIVGRAAGGESRGRRA